MAAMDFSGLFGDLPKVEPSLPPRIDVPRIDFDLTPRTLGDDSAMQLLLSMLEQSGKIAEQSLEITRSARNIARGSLLVSFVALIIAFISFAAAYKLW